jgi:hypothetical protein
MCTFSIHALRSLFDSFGADHYRRVFVCVRFFSLPSRFGTLTACRLKILSLTTRLRVANKPTELSHQEAFVQCHSQLIATWQLIESTAEQYGV